MASRERPRIAACIMVAGDAVTGVVLYRLLFWWPKASREIEGRRYFAKSYDELQHETGLTYKQVKSALMRLRKQGLITTLQRDFGGRNVTHFMLTATCVQELQLAQSGQPGGPKWDNCGGPNGTTPYTQGGQQGGLQGVSGAASPAHGNSGEIGQEVPEGDGKVAKAADILATTKWGKKHKPDSGSELAFAWKNAMADVYGEVMVHLTGEQVGKLMHVIPKVGEGNAAKVIEYAISNWIEFVKTVETEAGIKTTPAKPNVTFFLKHAAIAASLCAQPEKPAPKKQEAVAGVQAVKSVQLISHSDSDKIQSMDELLSILGDEDE